tara:strand:+ start:130 stop:321 length:192 start_codon:yes stop_codon:yes gene_type:complete
VKQDAHGFRHEVTNALVDIKQKDEKWFHDALVTYSRKVQSEIMTMPKDLSKGERSMSVGSLCW